VPTLQKLASHQTRGSREKSCGFFQREEKGRIEAAEEALFAFLEQGLHRTRDDNRNELANLILQ
jgi:hypothetical protein